MGLLFTTIALVGVAFVPGPYVVNGRSASPDEFVAFAVPALGSYLLMSFASLVLASGLRRRRRWARPLIVALGVAAIAVPFGLAFMSGVPLIGGLGRLLVTLLMLVVLWWQLYYDDDIVAYYASIAASIAEAERGSPTRA
jgi:hypothetical protein